MDTERNSNPSVPGGNGNGNGNGNGHGNGHSASHAPTPPRRAPVRPADPWDLLTPWGVASACYRHKWKIVAVFVPIMAVAAVLLYLAPPIYQSNVKLLSRIGRESLATDPVVTGQPIPVSQTRESEINTELAILQSRLLLERVVDRITPQRILSPDGAQRHVSPAPRARTPIAPASPSRVVAAFIPPVPPREKAIEKLGRNLEIDVEGKSNIIDVTLNAFSPQVAHDALDELVRLYLERHIEVYSSPAQTRLLREQTDHLAAALNQKEEELTRFRQSHNLIVPERQKEIQLTQLAALQRDLADATSQVGASNAKIAALNRSMQDVGSHIELSRTSGKTNYAADSMKNRLAELRQKESDYASRYSSDTRFLENLRE